MRHLRELCNQLLLLRVERCRHSDIHYNKQIAGAAIDVTREEPLPANSPLIGIPNLILTPHLGGSSDDVRMQGSEMVVKILVSWRDGRRLVNCVQERIEA